jgi:SAM-dependent methyltransferase
MTKIKQAKGQWEDEYERGQWMRLHGDEEFAHYTIVAGYIQKNAQPISLLDVGCGEGVVLRYLNLDLIASYTGVDLAQAALDKIVPKRSQDRYICSSLEDYSPEGKWDVILFNEVLYYTYDPVAHLERIEHSLTPGGFIVISMHKKANPLAWNNRCIRSVQRYFRRADYVVEDAVELSKIDGSAAWQVFVVRPGSS